jgi:DNA invertase Pin-like site-specific DNA recombinase
MRTLGYSRVSTDTQNLDRQLIALVEYGIAQEDIFTDKLSGKNTARPGLQKLLATVEQGDSVVVESFSRFSRDTRDLLGLVDKLTEKGVKFVSLKECFDTSTPTGTLMLTMFAALSQFERETTLQRQAEGISAAKLRGVVFGRPLKTPPDDFADIVRLRDKGELTLKQAVERSGLKQATFYNRLREFRQCKAK